MTSIDKHAAESGPRAKSRRLFWPVATTAAMLCVLLGLGTWQVKRLAWKNAIMADIARAESGPPVPLPIDPKPFEKVSVTGVFMPDKTALFGDEVRVIPSGPAMGARLIVPLRRQDGPPILVDRGWVPVERAAPVEQPAGPVTIVGYVRMGDRAGWFSAADDLAARRFFTLDPDSIAASLGVRESPPFVLVALSAELGSAPEVVRTWPDAARHLPRPPNNHLSYAITWYGLAAALLAVFFAWLRKGSPS